MSISLNNVESRVTALENISIKSSMKVDLLLDVDIICPHNKTFNLTNSVKNYDELLFIAAGINQSTGTFRVHPKFYVPEINNTDRYTLCLSSTDNNIFFTFPSDDKIHIYYAHGDSALYKIYGVKYILSL